jgi:PAS domain S-box-containing protein
MAINIRPATKLYLLAFIMSVLIIVVGVFGISGMKKMNQNTKTMYADRMLPLQQLTQMRYAYTTGILITAEELDNHTITASQAKKKIELAQNAIDENWQAYSQTYLTPEETQLVTQTKLLKTDAGKAISQLEQKIKNRESGIADNITNENIYAAVTPVIVNINALTQLQIKVSAELNKSNEQLYSTTETKLYLLIFISLLIAAALGFLIIGDTRKFIRDLKISNRKIKEAEEKWKAFIKYAGDSILILDPRLNIVDANDSALLLLGYSYAELTEMKISDIMTADDQKLLSVKVNRINNEGGSVHERKLKRKDGSLVDTEVNVRLLESVGYISIIRDMTDRRNAESSVKESEEKYRYLFQNNPAYIIIWDLENFNVLEVNDIVVDQYGYNRDEWNSMSVFTYSPEEDHERIKVFAQKMLNSSHSISKTVWRHLKKNGEEMLMEIVSHKINYRGHSAILSLASDVTEQMRTRTALRKSEDMFRSLVEHAADAIFMVADDGLIFDVNRSASELLYYSKEELIGNTVLNLHPKGLHDAILETWDVLRKNNSLIDERMLQRKDGTIVEVEISRQMLPDRSGAIAIVRDITERKNIEEKIKQSEANYRQLFDNSPAPMWVIDGKTGSIMQVNQACLKNYGYKEQEILGMNITEISANEPALPSKTNMNEPFFMGQQQHIKKSGELIDVVTSSMPVKMNNEKSILMIAIDVTEKNLYEQKLTRAAIKVQEDERYEIGGELHDNVCQLLAGSLMFLGIIKRSLPEQSMEMYDRTHQTISMATDEIRNLSHRLAPAFFDKETLEEVLKRLLETFNVENKYTISLAVDNKINSRLLSHDLQLNLYRILQEQLRNVMKHAKATGIAVAITMKDDMLQMKITDNGIGFDAKLTQGGIGVANMNRRVRLFAGNFKINSSVGKGCEVLVDIPLADQYIIDTL